MNAGANKATGGQLYFLHADSIPPMDFIGQILKAHATGFEVGCFRLQFDWDTGF